MGKRFGLKIPPFPPRWESRYFGSYAFNDRNGYLRPLDALLAECAPSEEDGIVFGVPDLDGFPLTQERPPASCTTPPKRGKR